MPPGPSERKSNFRGGGGRDLGIRPAQFQGLRPPTAENTARRPRGGAVFSAVGAGGGSSRAKLARRFTGALFARRSVQLFYLRCSAVGNTLNEPTNGQFDRIFMRRKNTLITPCNSVSTWSEPSLYAQLPCGGGGRGLCTGPAQFQRLRGEGCEVSTDPGGIRAEKRGLALLVICIPTRKQ